MPKTTDLRLDEVLKECLGEAIHTGFRKGTDHPTADKIWRLIRDLPDDEFAKYVEWVRWSLRVSAGLEI